MASHDLTIPARTPAIRGLSGTPVLVYHGLWAGRSSMPAGLPAQSQKYWITADQFRGQLAAIAHRGCTITSLDDLVGTGTDPLSGPQVALTFDDGNLSDYELAFRQLSDASAHAHFFVNTSTVGTPGYLAWPQIREMHAHGMSIHSHSHDHRYLTFCGADEVRRQLTLSKRTIEDRLGSKVRFLAVPYGDFNQQVVRIAQEAGYQALCTGRSWPARQKSFTIDRTAVYAHTRDREFGKLLAGDPMSYGRRALRAGAISIPKQVWLQFRSGRPAAQGARALS